MNQLQKQVNLAMKSSTAKGIAVLILVALISFMAWDSSENSLNSVETRQRLLPTITYQTSSTRTANVVKYCPGLSRTSLVTSSDISSAKANQNTVTSALGIDGNILINKVASGDTGGAMTMISSNVVNLAIFVGVFLVPFIVFLWAWPFLCCCCCCPSCCPSKCCQQPEDQPYTKCELLWPTVTLILALVLIIATSIYGFVSASNVGNSFNSMTCSLAIFTDDLLNGNVTTNGSSFFTGLNVFSSNLTDLNTNLNYLATSMADLSNNAAGTTYTDVNNIAAVQNSYVTNLPTGAGTGPMVLNYQTPINNAVAPTTLASTFPNVLGTYSTNATLLYNLYASIEYARLFMQGIKDSASNFDSSRGTISAQITPMRTTINGLIKDVTDMDSNMGNFLSILQAPGSFGNIGMQGFYGFLIGFSFFCLLGVLLMAFCNKPGCRHLMYFSCVLLFIGALLAFLISVLFSIFVPFFTWTCSYLTVAVSSPSGFSTNFGSLLSNSTVNQISVCMPYGDGNIVSQVAGSATNGINNLTSVISNLNSFNNATLESYITGNLTALTTVVNKYANGDISDLDSTNNNILAGFSDPSNSTNSAGCTGFTDSWVPSNAQDTSYSSAISCKSSSTNQAGANSCTSTLTNAGTGSCSGCMDTTQILTKYATALGVSTNVNAKYGGGCAFASVLSNAWTNYFNAKYTKIGYPSTLTSAGTTLQGRIATATPKITSTSDTSAVFYSIDQFRSVVNTVNSNLATIQTLTDPTYGMLSGLNCKLFGQDFVTFQNVICGSFYNNLYIIRLTFGIAAWGILFVLCCSVCAGVRHYKQTEMQKRISDSPDRNDFDGFTKQNLNKGKQ